MHTLSLHDALPISRGLWRGGVVFTTEPRSDTQFISAVGVGMNEAACLLALGVPW
jgi:hypothetical protein